MCLFELSTALCTGIRTIQTFFIDDPTLTTRKGLLYLLLEQGQSTNPYIHDAALTRMSPGIVYFLSVLSLCSVENSDVLTAQ